MLNLGGKWKWLDLTLTVRNWKGLILDNNIEMYE